MTKRQRFWLQLIVSMVLLGVLLYFLDFQEAKEVLSRVEPFHILLLFTLYAGDRVLMAFKWNMLLKVHDNHFSFWDSVKLYYVSTFMGFLLPLGGVGPDIVRLYKIKEKGVPAKVGIASILVERVLGLMATLAFTIIGGIVLLHYLVNDELEPVIQWIIVGTVAGVGLVLLAIFNDKTRTAIFSRVKLLKHPKITGFMESLAKYKSHKPVLGSFLVLSLIENLFPVTAILVAGTALGAPITFWYCLAVVPVATVLERLPISFGGIGLREGSFIVLFGLLGVAYAEALLIGLLNFICFMISLLPGLFWMLTEGVNPKAISVEAVPSVDEGLAKDKPSQL